MDIILTVITAIIFYCIGFYAGQGKMITNEAVKAATTLKKRLNRVPAGVINYPTLEEQKYRGSKEEERDNAQAETWRKAGI